MENLCFFYHNKTIKVIGLVCIEIHYRLNHSLWMSAGDGRGATSLHREILKTNNNSIYTSVIADICNSLTG